MGLVEDYDRLCQQMRENNSTYRLFVADSPPQLGCLGIVSAAVLEPVFLPMATLGYMIEDKPQHPAIPVIATSFAYLMEVAGLLSPFANSVVSQIYEDIGQSAGDYGDEEGEEDHCQIVWDELAEGEEYCCTALRYIKEQTDLSQWKRIIAGYGAVKASNKNLVRASRRLLGLYRKYPGSSMHDGVYPDLAEPGEDEPLTIDQCLGFCYGNGDRVPDDFECWINHPAWEEDHNYLPMGYIVFPPKGKPLVGSSEFTERLYSCCAALAGALQTFKM
ncbi:hypothetical protein [Chitinophaga barathri]|uniref:Uncharacterized protein n=1 Tax=Chitinophaga barathri TaxID=1647451 RepID=A0A3N4N610_9BACT|nr:hypothetical protein [Chitinophaga barathri]RPD43073.1 hypothetical protein EG028_01920 [Chitinophaga barathri]